MKIVRKENGNILLTDASGNTIKRLPEYAVLELKRDTEGEFVRVAYGHQNKHDIYVNQITHTQIEPAAEVAFSGTAQDLLNLLSTSFFFEVVSGQGVSRNYESGGRYPFNDDTRYADNNTSYILNKVYAVLIKIPKRLDIRALTIRVPTAIVGNAIAGIYNLDDSGIPSTKLQQLDTEFDLNVTGDQTINFTTPLTLDAGYYASCINLSVTATLKGIRESLVFESNTGDIQQALTRYEFNSTYSPTMPNDISGGGITISVCPLIALQVN